MEQHFPSHDPDVEYELKFRHNSNFCLVGYQELEKPKEQILITEFIKTKYQ